MTTNLKILSSVIAVSTHNYLCKIYYNINLLTNVHNQKEAVKDFSNHAVFLHIKVIIMIQQSLQQTNRFIYLFSNDDYFEFTL